MPLSALAEVVTSSHNSARSAEAAFWRRAGSRRQRAIGLGRVLQQALKVLLPRKIKNRYWSVWPGSAFSTEGLGPMRFRDRIGL